MYFVKYGEDYLYDPRSDEYQLFDLSFDAEENTCGFFEFTIYPSHPMYNKLKERDTRNSIEVYDDEEIVFSGFIYELDKEFQLNRTVKCKGDLSYLNDSIVRPYSTLERGYGDQAPSIASAYFEWLIRQHNRQVEDNKKFTVGINQCGNLDPNSYIFRENNQYPTTIEEIDNKLIGILGGYIRTRKEGKVRYIDYISEWENVNTQILDFGVNLMDYAQTDDSSSIATFIVPLGARMRDTDYPYDDGYRQTTDKVVNPEKEYYTLRQESDSYYYTKEDITSFESGVTYYEYNEDYDESDLPLTIDGLPGHSYDDGFKINDDIIYHESSVSKYGFIGVKYENSDITTKEDLIQKAILVLKELISPIRTIEIKAVDMHLINPEMKPIRIGEYVRVRSGPHDFDSYMLCTKIDLDLTNPENSMYTLGTTFDTLTGIQNARIKELNKNINQQYEAAAAIGEEAKASAKTASTIAEESKKESEKAKEVAEKAKEAADVAIVSVVNEYAVTSDPYTVPTSGWSTESPEYTNDVFVWSRSIVTYGNGTIITGDPVLITGNTGSKGEDAVLLRIDSSRGTVFKNNSITTVLTVTIYKGSERITNITELHKVFGPGVYLEWSWQKIDESEYGIISSTDKMISNDGFSLTISADEVDTKVTFMCELKE